MGILIFSGSEPYKRGNVNNQFGGKAIFFLVRKYVMGASRTILRLLVSEERQSSYKKVPYNGRFYGTEFKTSKR